MKKVNDENVSISGTLRRVSYRHELSLSVALFDLLNNNPLVVKDHLVCVIFGDREVQGVRPYKAGLGKVDIELKMGVRGPNSIAVCIAVRIPNTRSDCLLLQDCLL